MDGNRRLVVHGLGKTDDPQHISRRLCKDACDRAFALKVVYHQKKHSDDLVNVREGIGQVGFLRGSRIPTSPGSGVHYAAIPITAKRNFRKIENQDHELYPADAMQPSFFLKSDLSERLLAFGDLNVSVVNETIVLRECSLSPAEWSFGIDISVGQTVSNRSDGVTNDRYSWELAGRNYEFKKDQKVGIAVFNTLQPTAKSASPDPNAPLAFTPEELAEIYGRALETKVYAGRITCVGENHIEYDINTFEGCSGAIVFLLDENQHESVAPEDCGKAIAIHAGTHPLLSDRNFAFKLAKFLEEKSK